MKILRILLLVILVLLALASGVAKVMLLEQEVAFFGKYGFSNLALMAFGVAQLVGGLFMIFAKTRFYGAAIVAITFLASLILLLLEGSVPAGIVTGLVLLLLGLVMKQSRSPDPE